MTRACGTGQRGGYTPAEQQRRERLRLDAAGRFARGDGTPQIAADLRVTRTVRRWRAGWRDGGTAALRSRGPVSRERLSPAGSGPGWSWSWGKGRWRTVRRGPAVDAGPDQDADRQAVPRRLHRRGHLAAAAPGTVLPGPGAPAMERDDAAVAVWKDQVWPESTARDLGAFICFEDEAGQGLRPPKGRTWPHTAPTQWSGSAVPAGRVSITGVVSTAPDTALALISCVYRTQGKPKGSAGPTTGSDHRCPPAASAPAGAAGITQHHLAPELTNCAEKIRRGCAYRSATHRT